MKVVDDLSEELMVISTKGQVIRIPLDQRDANAARQGAADQQVPGIG